MRPVLVAGALVLAVGCSAQPTSIVDTNGSTGEPVLGPVPVVLSGRSLRLPVEEYLPTAEQSDRLARARIVLIRECLARFGVAYDVVPVPSGAYGPVNLTDRRYGITDPDLARTWGYGLGERDPARMPRPDRPDIGPAGQTALTGQGPSVVNGVAVPPDGCLGTADRALNTEDGDISRGSALQFTSFAQSRVDSRVRTVFGAWSACMAGGGYRYADPLAAAADPAFANALDQPALDRHQVDVAGADIACKAETNLVGIWFAVESAYQRRAIAADRPALEAARAAIDARDRAAAQVMGHGGSDRALRTG